jgi:hypothetical protein
VYIVQADVGFWNLCFSFLKHPLRLWAKFCQLKGLKNVKIDEDVWISVQLPEQITQFQVPEERILTCLLVKSTNHQGIFNTNGL